MPGSTPGSTPRWRRRFRLISAAASVLSMVTAGLTGLPASATATSPSSTLSTPSTPSTPSTLSSPSTVGTATHLRPRSVVRPARAVRSPWPSNRRYSTLGAGTVASSGPRPLTTFTKSFSWNGTHYPYQMVGTDPQGAAKTTTLASTLVPVTLRQGGLTAPTTATTVGIVTRSGLFTARTFPGGTGQYGDVFLRTQFWSWLAKGTKAWHVVMAAPKVTTTAILDIPGGAGEITTVNGVRVAMVDVDWLDSALTSAVTAARPDVLTQLLTTNVVACAPYTPDLSSCGIGGYHSAVTDARGIHTYTYQSYLHPAIFGSGTGFTDIGPMSHELAEWLTDPFVNNTVPPWTSPLAPQYGCMQELESGDPVVGRFLRLGGLAYQDEAYLAWFARTPSTSWRARYTWFASFTTFSPSCVP